MRPNALRRVDSPVWQTPSASGQQVLPHYRYSANRGVDPSLPLADFYSAHLAGAHIAFCRRMATAIHRTLVRGQAARVLPRLAVSLRRVALVDCQNSETTLISTC